MECAGNLAVVPVHSLDIASDRRKRVIALTISLVTQRETSAREKVIILLASMVQQQRKYR